MSADFVYLASGSPRRRELLTQIGVRFRVVDVAVSEAVIPGEKAEMYVERLAIAKATAGFDAITRFESMRAGTPTQGAVLGADTAVVLDGHILVKPRDRTDGERMLLELAGRTHTVLTAVALATRSGVTSRLSQSEVTFRPITVAEARAYWDTGEPCDKAGGYGIQGLAAVFITALRGSYSGVMGLPLFETAELLALADVPRWVPEDGGHTPVVQPKHTLPEQPRPSMEEPGVGSEEPGHVG